MENTQICSLNAKHNKQALESITHHYLAQNEEYEDVKIVSVVHKEETPLYDITFTGFHTKEYPLEEPEQNSNYQVIAFFVMENDDLYLESVEEA